MIGVWQPWLSKQSVALVLLSREIWVCGMYECGWRCCLCPRGKERKDHWTRNKGSLLTSVTTSWQSFSLWLRYIFNIYNQCWLTPQCVSNVLLTYIVYMSVNSCSSPLQCIMSHYWRSYCCCSIERWCRGCVRLQQVKMSEFDGELYERFSSSVRAQVKSLHVILDTLQVVNLPTVHHRIICLLCFIVTLLY